jgi:hypothetical protein
MREGEVWNESIEARDTATGRLTRQLTATGIRNNTPTYHFNTAFSADGRYLVFVAIREGQSAVLRAELETGELKALLVTEGFGKGRRVVSQEPWAPGPLGEGGFFCTQLSLIPATGWAIACGPRQMLAVHIETGEKRTLFEDAGDEWCFSCPAGNASGSKVYVAMRPAHPDIVAGHHRPLRPYRDAMMAEHGSIPCRILEIDFESGEQRAVYDRDNGGNHVLPSPRDEDLLLFDIDLPPTFEYYGDNCESPRAHLYRISTGELTPLVPRNRHQFQSHTNWNRDGTRIYYHGPAYEGHEQPVYQGGRIGEMMLGVCDLSGESIFEMNFPEYYYGHVSTHTQAEAIVTDALCSEDLVSAIHYEDLSASGLPRIEVLARHNNDWGALPGQERDPHCHMSPDGRWVSYNRAWRGRSDVYVVRLD